MFGGGLCQPLYIRGDRVTWKVLAEYSWSLTTTQSGSFLCTAASPTPIRVVTRVVRYIHKLSLILEHFMSINSPAAPGLTYTKTELPLRSKTTKKSTKTAKNMILGGWPPCNPPRIEIEENSITLAASRQKLFSWRFGRQVKYIYVKIVNTSKKYYTRQWYNFPWRLVIARKAIYLVGINRQGNAYYQQKILIHHQLIYTYGLHP